MEKIIRLYDVEQEDNVNNKENKIDMEKHDKSENSGYKPSQEFIDHFFKPVIIGVGNPLDSKDIKDGIIKGLEKKVESLSQDKIKLEEENKELKIKYDLALSDIVKDSRSIKELLLEIERLRGK